MFNDWTWKQLALPLLLLCALLINKSMVQAPAPKAADSDLAGFSAERAMEHVRWIATEPHAVGTPANKRVREQLVAHLKNAGLEVEVQSTQILDGYRSGSAEHFAGLSRERHSAAFVNNVVARLKGTEQTGKALVLMSHYDSVYYGPGAGDDASGTAALLETLRAIQTSEPLANDVIFLFTDAEEEGLFGAQAYFSKHRWADETGLVLNFEARGSKGPASMFQTSGLNDKLIEALASSVAKPLANSLTATIYRKMPNDTDLSISLNEGIPGMNFAFIEGFYDYHTKGDNAENLSPATLQHLGDQALAMTLFMGNQTLPLEDSKEVVFFDFLTLFLVSYPLWVSWLVAGAAVFAMAWFAKDKMAAQQISITGMLRSAAASILFIVGFALIVDLLFLMIGGRSGDFVESRRLFALANEQLIAFALIGLAFALAWFRMLVRGITILWLIGGGLLAILLFVFEPSWKPAAIAAVSTGLAYGLLRSPVSNDERLLSSLDLYLLSALAIQFIAPAGSYLFVWPFILVTVGLILNQRGKAGIGAVSLLALLSALWLGYFTEMGYSALGVAFPSVIAVPFGLLLLMLVPIYMHLTRNSHLSVATVSAALGLAIVGYTGFATGFSDRLNRPTEVFYLVTSDKSGSNHFGSRLKQDDSWSAQLLGGKTREIDAGSVLPQRTGTIKIAAAPNSAVQGISVRDVLINRGSTSFTLSPGYRGDIFAVQISSTAPMSEIKVGGEPLRKKETPPSEITLYYYAVPETGLTFDIITEGTISLHAAEVTSAWPEDITAQIPDKPADIMIAPYRLSDTTISSVKHVFSGDD